MAGTAPKAVAVSEPATQETPRMCCKTCGAGILSQQSQSSSSEREGSPEGVSGAGGVQRGDLNRVLPQKNAVST